MSNFISYMNNKTVNLNLVFSIEMGGVGTHSRMVIPKKSIIIRFYIMANTHFIDWHFVSVKERDAVYEVIMRREVKEIIQQLE